MELSAMRGELARQILNIDSWEVLDKMQRYLNRIGRQSAGMKPYAVEEDEALMVAAEDEVPYRTKAEILAGVEQAFECAKLAREGKVKGRPIEELLNEL
ncbi:MAG: hypothetical protein IJ013_06970 [Bacteroidaceae bacterium]|nr:hypothetical protein [Bacteroidaceae bacterium]